MIKQEGNFSQQALTDGFSNNELTFGAAWGWERESGAGSSGRFGAENSERATSVAAGLRGRTAAPLRGSSGVEQAWLKPHWAMGWGDVVAPGHPIRRAAPLVPSSPPGQPGPSDLRWGCGDAEQSNDEAREEAAAEGAEGIKIMLQQIGFNYANKADDKGEARQGGTGTW